MQPAEKLILISVLAFGEHCVPGTLVLQLYTLNSLTPTTNLQRGHDQFSNFTNKETES